MFIVTTMIIRKNAVNKTEIIIRSVDGVVYNEEDFNRWLDQKYPKMRLNTKRSVDVYGDLSISYSFRAVSHKVVLLMSKIEEIGQPNY